MTMSPHYKPDKPRALVDNRTALGDRLQQQRLARGLKQSELAKLAGCSTSYISRMERSNRLPPRETVSALAAALGIEREQLTGMTFSEERYRRLADVTELLERILQEVAHLRSEVQELMEGE